MSDLVVHWTLGNLAVSGLLAAWAWAAHRWSGRPWLAHVLWLLVLVKLLTPPIISAPVLAPSSGSTAIESLSALTIASPVDGASVASSPAAGAGATIGVSNVPVEPGVGGVPWGRALAWVWIAGAATLFVLIRLAQASRAAPGGASGSSTSDRETRAPTR